MLMVMLMHSCGMLSLNLKKNHRSKPQTHILKHFYSKSVAALSELVSHLFSPVDDVLGVGQAVDAGPPDDGVVPGGGVRHLHGTELQEGLAQRHPTEQHLSARGEWSQSVTGASYKCYI